jgi:hypothetical protein
MLIRLASVLVSFSLLGSAATAGSFASAPPPLGAHVERSLNQPVPPVEAVRMPVRVAPDRDAVRKALAKRRAKNLAAFRAYRKAGIYPHNTWRMGPLNVWIDAEGHLCAAATMISKDGKLELVKTIGETDNNIRLLNVLEGPLLDWMLTSGFTMEEIDRIQAPSVMPAERMMKTPGMLAEEDARLRKLYAEVDGWLVKRAKSGLDTATDRLMANPELAQRLLDGTL